MAITSSSRSNSERSEVSRPHIPQHPMSSIYASSPPAPLSPVSSSDSETERILPSFKSPQIMLEGCIRCRDCQSCIRRSGSEKTIEPKEAFSTKNEKPSHESLHTKIDNTFKSETWTKSRWTHPGKFLEASWRIRNEGPEMKRRWGGYTNWFLSEDSFSIIKDIQMSREDKTKFLIGSGAWDYMYESLDNELKSLEKVPVFGQWDMKAKDDQLASVFKGIRDYVPQYAPLLNTLFSRLAQNQRAAKESKQAKDEIAMKDEKKQTLDGQSQFASKMIAIISILLYSRHAKKNNNLAMSFGLHCLNVGIGKTGLSLIQKLGLCPGYSTLDRCRRALTETALIKLKEVGQGGKRFYTAYDNFEYRNTHRHERVDESSTFESITTAILLQGVDRKEAPLLQSMRRGNRYINPLIMISRNLPLKEQEKVHLSHSQSFQAELHRSKSTSSWKAFEMFSLKSIRSSRTRGLNSPSTPKNPKSFLHIRPKAILFRQFFEMRVLRPTRLRLLMISFRTN